MKGINTPDTAWASFRARKRFSTPLSARACALFSQLGLVDVTVRRPSECAKNGHLLCVGPYVVCREASNTRNVSLSKTKF